MDLSIVLNPLSGGAVGQGLAFIRDEPSPLVGLLPGSQGRGPAFLPGGFEALDGETLACLHLEHLEVGVGVDGLVPDMVGLGGGWGVR